MSKPWLILRSYAKPYENKVNYKALVPPVDENALKDAERALARIHWERTVGKKHNIDIPFKLTFQSLLDASDMRIKHLRSQKYVQPSEITDLIRIMEKGIDSLITKAKQP